MCRLDMTAAASACAAASCICASAEGFGPSRVPAPARDALRSMPLAGAAGSSPLGRPSCARGSGIMMDMVGREAAEAGRRAIATFSAAHATA